MTEATLAANGESVGGSAPATRDAELTLTSASQSARDVEPALLPAYADVFGPVIAPTPAVGLPTASGAQLLAEANRELPEASVARSESGADVSPGVTSPPATANDATLATDATPSGDAFAGIERPSVPQLSPVYAERPLPEIGASSFQLGLVELEETEDFAAASAGTPVGPQILNADEIQKQMVRRYPPHLLDAGVGGTVVLAFLVDETGMPAAWQIVQSSGHQPLDEAALKMASTFRFSPARTRRDQVVPVWTRFPIRFQVLR
jgi:TonB family protein